jgi:dolichyldiphosphatase
MFAGQLGCEAVNFVLKRIIKEERPRHVHRAGGKGYGMPSSHAQFAFFWAVSLTLFLLVRHRPSGKSGGKTTAVEQQGDQVRVRSNRFADIERYAHEPWTLAQRAAVSFAALVLASLIAWSRIYLGYHTGKQVAAGCTAGSVTAVAWFLVTAALRSTGLLAWGLDMPVARWFRLRDLVVEEDLCQAGWEKWESRKQVRRTAAEIVKKRS